MPCVCDLYFKHVAFLSYNFSILSIRLLKCFHKPKLVVKSIQNIIDDGLLKKKKKKKKSRALYIIKINFGSDGHESRQAKTEFDKN